MASRSTMRLTMAQMMEIVESEGVHQQGPAQFPHPHAVGKPDTFYTVTEHITSSQGVLYNVIFGPIRSIDDALHALVHMRPFTMEWLVNLHGIQWEPHNHFRYKAANGDSVFIQVEQETNPTVFVTDDSQELFIIVHRVTNFDDSPVSEVASLGGTFLTKPEANVAAVQLFMKDVKYILWKVISR